MAVRGTTASGFITRTGGRDGDDVERVRFCLPEQEGCLEVELGWAERGGAGQAGPKQRGGLVGV